MLAWRVAYRWSRRCLTRWPLTRALLILYSARHRIDPGYIVLSIADNGYAQGSREIGRAVRGVVRYTQDEDLVWIGNVSTVCRYCRARTGFHWRRAVAHSDTDASPHAAGNAHSDPHALADTYYYNRVTHDDRKIRQCAIGNAGSGGCPRPALAGR